MPPSAKEEGDSRLSPRQGPSLMLEQRVMGLPSSSVAPKIQPGMCRAPGGDTPRGANPATLALTSLFLKFPCRIRGNPARREVTVRGSSHDTPAGCRAPLRPPPCLLGLALQVHPPRSCSKPLVHPCVAPVWQQCHSPGTGCGVRHQPAPTGCPPLHLPRPQGVSPEEDAAVPAPCFGPVVECQDVRGEAALRGVPAGVPIACGGTRLSVTTLGGQGLALGGGGSLRERDGVTLPL